MIYCKSCVSVLNKAAHKRDPKASGVRRMRRKYGLTPESRLALRESQGNRCKICKLPLEGSPKEAIDHCHETGKTRGILCVRCNTGIGQLKDSPELLREAADYIESYRNHDPEQQKEPPSQCNSNSS